MQRNIYLFENRMFTNIYLFENRMFTNIVNAALFGVGKES